LDFSPYVGIINNTSIAYTLWDENYYAKVGWLIEIWAELVVSSNNASRDIIVDLEIDDIVVKRI